MHGKREKGEGVRKVGDYYAPAILSTAPFWGEIISMYLGNGRSKGNLLGQDGQLGPECAVHASRIHAKTF